MFSSEVTTYLWCAKWKHFCQFKVTLNIKINKKVRAHFNCSFNLVTHFYGIWRKKGNSLKIYCGNENQLSLFLMLHLRCRVKLVLFISIIINSYNYTLFYYTVFRHSSYWVLYYNYNVKSSKDVYSIFCFPHYNTFQTYKNSSFVIIFYILSLTVRHFSQQPRKTITCFH